MEITQLQSLPANFFSQDSLTLAAKLLNCVMLVSHKNDLVGGRIVETEAYMHNDPASHSFKGQTPRNSAMFLESGILYTYVSYGVHICANIVSGAKAHADAILLRAVEPIWGLQYMQAQRARATKASNTDFPLNKLARGPGCMTKALGISMEYNKQSIGTKLPNRENATDNPQVYILQLPKAMWCKDIAVGPRIGISMSIDYPHRFFAKNNSYVSAHKRHF